jgi:MFS family permease
MALLATGYIPVLLQMYSTDALNFGASENGWLISLNSLIRGLFLTFAFPVIISKGRSWLDRRQSTTDDKISAEESAIPDLPTRPEELEADPVGNETEPTEPIKPRPGEEESFKFDLFYTRWSILADGILTGLATFTTQGWHMFLVAILLPLAAGTGSAAKGTILQMCSPEERADALSAISLVEMVGRLSSVGVFGLIFSAFAELGKPHLTFLANGAVAVLAFVVLCLTRFPPKGSKRVVEGAE